MKKNRFTKRINWVIGGLTKNNERDQINEYKFENMKPLIKY
jgi:hypothetical protein